MRGFVFVEFVELVETLYGLDFTDELIESSDLESKGAYTSVATYPLAELVTLVGNLSKKTGTPVGELIKIYGTHLFSALAARHERILGAIDHPFVLFENLNDHVHAEVRKLYPDAEVPSFTAERVGPNRMRLRYESSRALPDLAEGLIVGACRHFGRSVDVSREDRSGGAGTKVDFQIELK